jgi:hypothetical protein
MDTNPNLLSWKMNLDLDELIKAEIIDDSIADKIRNYYADKKKPSSSPG